MKANGCHVAQPQDPDGRQRVHPSGPIDQVSTMELARLQMQHKICQRLGIDVESAKRELKGFGHATDVGKLASNLADQLPYR